MARKSPKFVRSVAFHVKQFHPTGCDPVDVGRRQETPAAAWLPRSRTLEIRPPPRWTDTQCLTVRQSFLDAFDPAWFGPTRHRSVTGSLAVDGRTSTSYRSGAPAGSLRRFPEAVDELKEVGSGRVRTLTGEFACLETRCASATIRHPWDRSNARFDVSRGTRQQGRLRCVHLQIATDQTRYRRSTVSYRLRVRHDTTYMAAH